MPIRQATAVARVLASVVDVTAAWLHGSAVAGGLPPDSDLDVLAVVERPLRPAERTEVLSGVLRLSGRAAEHGPARPVELTVVVRSDVVPWRYPPTCDLQYGEWLRAAVLAGRPPARGAEPDLAVALTDVRGRGLPLIGPPPDAVLDPVPPSDLRAAMVDTVPGLLADLVGDERNVLLTLARIVTTLDTWVIEPKDVAGRAVAPLLPRPSAQLLQLAASAYLGDAADDWSARRGEAREAAELLVHLIRDRTAT
ncbi:MAG TPA: DUF4111 domain-containing protein [Actinotalea sp.]|nr:DUF4111 domain-containing protein [Actinotalea sp.]